MKKKQVQIEYQKKINLINKFNKLYYDKSQPAVTDEDYDKLKNEILHLEAKYSFLKSESSS